MSARILGYSLGLFSLLREILYTQGRITQEPLAAAYISTFQGLRTEWQNIQVEEITHIDKITLAQAFVDKTDQNIDTFSGRVSNLVNEYTDGNTRKQLRTALFKNKSLSKFRKPVLAGQLQDMADWSDILKNCGIQPLVLLADEAAALIEAGKNAAEQRNAAQSANRQFRDVGARKQFIDKCNAARKEMHGALAKLPFQHPNLPTNFADGFFASGPTRDEEETIDEVKASIEALEEQLAERTALLKKLEEDAENAAREEQERKAKADEADSLEAQAKELLAKAAALKAASKK